MNDLEQKFLEILAAPDFDEKLTELSSAISDEAEPELTDEQRALLQSLMDVGLPPPEEIIRQAKHAEHNAAIDMARAEKLAKRQARRAARGKLKKR